MNGFEEILFSLKNGEIEDYLDIENGEKLENVSFGDINLTTGKIVCNDPLSMEELEVFTKSVEAGKYPVVGYTLSDWEVKRLAFAEIRFSDKTPEKFELALTDSESAEELGEDEYFGYEVYTGTGCFMDKECCDKIDVIFEDNNEEWEEIENEIEAEMDKNYEEDYSFANVKIKNCNANIITFFVEAGDVTYPSYWGYDKDGKVCCLITDFLAFEGE